MWYWNSRGRTYHPGKYDGPEAFPRREPADSGVIVHRQAWREEINQLEGKTDGYTDYQG